MPLYEYRCQACGNEIEIIQKFSDAPLQTCEKCGGELIKLLSSPAIQFNGAGWYITDYSRKGDSGSSSTSKPETTAGSTTPESKGAAAKGESGKSGADSTPASSETAKKDKTASG